MSDRDLQSPYRWQTTLKDGETISIRPIRPDDEPELVKFHQTLSERTVQLRYFSVLKLDTRISHERLAKICMSDAHLDIVQIAERASGQIIAVGRLSRIPGTQNAEFAVLVSDAFQGKGLGMDMVRHLLEIARFEKMNKVVADILNENREMQHICRELGFRLSAVELGDPTLRAVYAVPHE